MAFLLKKMSRSRREPYEIPNRDPGPSESPTSPSESPPSPPDMEDQSTRAPIMRSMSLSENDDVEFNDVFNGADEQPRQRFSLGKMLEDYFLSFSRQSTSSETTVAVQTQTDSTDGTTSTANETNCTAVEIEIPSGSDVCTSTKCKKVLKRQSELEEENRKLFVLVDELLLEQESLKVQFKDKMNALTVDNEKLIQELVESYQSTMTKWTKDQEALVAEILSTHQGTIQEWRISFVTEEAVSESEIAQMTLCGKERAKMVTTSNANDETPAKSEMAVGLNGAELVVADTTTERENITVKLMNSKLRKIYAEFTQLSAISQGFIVVGIGILGVVVGFSSWRFIIWAWPRLITFAAGMEEAQMLNIISWLTMVINSDAFRNFVEAWKNGEPLTAKRIKEFGSELLSFAVTNLAPALLTQRWAAKHAAKAVESKSMLNMALDM